MPAISKIKNDNLSARVYVEIRESLIAGRLVPNQRLRIAELSEQMGTSVTPVREALFRLVSEGALEMHAARSFSVPALSVENYRQIRAIRVELEGLAAELATKHISKAGILALEKSHMAFTKAEQAHKKLETLSENRKFHFSIYENAHMPLLLSNIEKMWAMMGPILNVFYDSVTTDYIGAEEHTNAIEALKQRNAKEARKAMQQDILRSADSIEGYILGHSDN